MILTKLSRLKKLIINSSDNISYEVLFLPHSNLLEITFFPFYRLGGNYRGNYKFSSAELISIASNKKKGFTLSCSTRLEDIVKAVHACPSSFFISRTSDESIITLEDALNAIYAPMKKI